jgi:nucleotide-binding universal stress UspA family protein
MKAVELQKLIKSKVIVFHSVEEHAVPTGIVMAPSYSIPHIYSVDNPDIQKAKEVYEKNAQAIIDRAEEIFSEYGLKIETRLVYEEHPVTYIDRVVKDEGIDLVIIGTKGGHSLLEEVLLGSVAEKVLRHIHCDILVIR